MRKRNGFVSNSSSSSFIIGLKEEVPTVEARKKIEKIFGDLDIESSVYHLVVDASDWIMDHMDSELEFFDGSEEFKLVEELKKKNFKIYYLNIDRYCAIDKALSHVGTAIENKDLFFKKIYGD